MKPISRTSTRQHLAARCAYLGATSRLYGRVLHLDFRGGTWPTHNPFLNLGEHIRGILATEGFDLDRVVAKNFKLVPPSYSTDPSAMDLSDAEWEKQRRTERRARRKRDDLGIG